MRALFTERRATSLRYRLETHSPSERELAIVEETANALVELGAKYVLFTYSPTDRRFPLLFELTHPLDDLESMLLKDFAGRILFLQTIYEDHCVGKPYILKNYRDALRELEHNGKIRTEPPAERRPKIRGEVTFSEKVKVTFPRST